MNRCQRHGEGLEFTRVFRTLAADDQAILTAVFAESRAVHSLAAERNVTRAAMYARFERLKRRMRDLVVDSGVSADDVELVLETFGLDAGVFNRRARGEELEGRLIPFRPDKLHPTAGAYEIWGAAVQARLAN